MNNTAAVPAKLSHEELQAKFLTIVPRIQLHARISSRDIKCQHKRADFISEVVSLCWKWWVRLHERGKDPSGFVSTLAALAARHVRNGRRLCGQLRPNDVLSPRAQQLRGFTVEKLPDFSTLSENPFSEALQDNTRSEVPDQVCFRLDFPAWLHTRTRRDRRMIADMATGERTNTLARKFRMSPGRVSQLREQFRRDWRQFVGDLPLVNAAG